MDAPSSSPRYTHRRPWSREEWIVAWDACPKDAQRYNGRSRDVREVAYLLGRTPAAVSRAFANLWAARTHGAEGLEHYAAICGQVVDEFEGNYHRLHVEAGRIRARMVDGSIHPRVEFQGEGRAIPPRELDQLSREFSSRAGVSRRDFVFYSREGSANAGFVLQLLWDYGPTFALGVAPGVAMEAYRLLKERWARRNPPPRVIVNEAWRLTVDQKHEKLELLVIRDLVPSYSPSKGREEEQAQVAAFVRAVQGVAREPAEGPRRRAEKPPKVSRSRVKELERAVGAPLGWMNPWALAELDSLVSVTNVKVVRREVAGAKKRAQKQSRIEDFEREQV